MQVGQTIDAVHRTFERLLRWFYPAALFFVLLIISLPKDFCPNVFISDRLELPPWVLLLVVSVTGGFAVYLFQTAVVNQPVSLAFIRLDWDVNALSDKEEYPKWGLGCVVGCFDRWARASEARWNNSERLRNWLNYAWGKYHATFITGWMTLGFRYWFKADSSLLATAPMLNDWMPWVGWFFVASALVSYAHLSRIRL